MGKLAELGLLGIIAAAAFPPLTDIARAASFEGCIDGYKNVQTNSYEERFQRDAAAWAVRCPKGWDEKYRNDTGDDRIMSDPCYGDPEICHEPLGITPTYFECSEVAADKLGTPTQVKQAGQIAQKLQESKGNVCHFAQ